MAVRLVRWMATGFLAVLAANAEPVVVRPQPAPGPADNPLKGFVPYSGPGKEFPHSLEFNYLPLSSLMVGPDRFDWTRLDRLLDDVASRGCQTVFRVWLEYPNQKTGVPAFLVEDGLRMRAWTNTNTQPLPPALDHTPDYEDPRLRAALKSFIAALGARYDGDPRIGFITAGLLGTWGEWHTHPHTEWFASKAVQSEVMDAYEAAFHRTPVLLRYPAGADDRVYASTLGRRLGFHDDSFAWATLETGRRQDSWFYMALLRKARGDVLERWKTAPIGGEIRPELWPCLWKDPGCEKGQDFARCVAETHASWLMDTSTSRPMSTAERERALVAARSLGYEIEVVEAVVDPSPGRLGVRVTLRNRGVAPFSADWPVRLEAVSADRPVAGASLPLSLRRLMPGESASAEAVLEVPGAAKTWLSIRIGVPNPLPNGRPLRFANVGGTDAPAGWMPLASVQAP